MTIGELKQITKGQIVELDSVFDNEISLYIEDKKVATGELIVINDKYAIKLEEVLNSNVIPQAAPEPVEVKKEPEPKPQAPKEEPAKPAEEAVEDEEFDYSDFEENS